VVNVASKATAEHKAQMTTIRDATRIDRTAAAAWYGRNRSRSRALFDLIDPSAYYARPIALRNPIVFYEGHLPAFSIISFINRGLGEDGVDPRLEQLFARGIDPDSVESAVPRSGADTHWPSREEVLAFGQAADARITRAMTDTPFDEARPAMRRGEALYTALEHEAMHQETLLYMWHRLPHEQKARPLSLP
jgi:gamma-glutamyl hercynylcysteine S-oxide synthase